jgi:hypothetical protein
MVNGIKVETRSDDGIGGADFHLERHGQFRTIHLSTTTSIDCSKEMGVVSI